MAGILNVNGQYLWMNIKLMNIIGVWPESTAGVIRCCLAEASCGTMMIMQCLALHDADMTEFTDVGSSAIQIMMILFKLGYFVVYRQKVLRLTRETQNQCRYLEKTFPHLRHLIENRERQLRIITLSFFGFVIFVGMIWMTYPILILIGLKEGGMSLPLKAKFPVDISDPFYYKLALLYEVLLSVVNVPIYALVNIFFVCLIMLTCGQLEILCSALRTEEVKNDDEILRCCIQVHNSILIFGKELRCVMDPIITMVFLIAMPTICLTGFQVTTNPSSGETMKFLGLMGAVLSEIWLCSYFGSELVEHVVKFSYSLLTFLNQVNEPRS